MSKWNIIDEDKIELWADEWWWGAHDCSDPGVYELCERLAFTLARLGLL